MAEDTNFDSLCLDLDPLTPSHVRDSVNGRYWGGSQCSGDPTAGLQQTDITSSHANSESESRSTGQCSGYGKSSPSISEKSVSVKNESISQVGSVPMLSTGGSGLKQCECICIKFDEEKGFGRWIIIGGAVQMKIEV